MDPVFLKGVFAFVGATAVFVGSIWLLLSMILGWRFGYLVMGSTLWGLMTILGVMWFTNALGPKGPETTWHAIGVGDLSAIESGGEDYDVSDYPVGAWEGPKRGRHLADLRKAPSPCLSLLISCASQDTLSEVSNIKPVMESLVSQAVNPIPGKREEVAGRVHGSLGLQSGKFAISEVRVKEATVDGKESIIAVAKAVPSDTIKAESLGGATEGSIENYLVKPGDSISVGQPIAEVKTETGNITIRASKDGKLLSQALKVGDKVKTGVPVAIIDVTGQPGQPAAAEVAAIRVRGALRSKALKFLIAFVVLFVIHLGLLSRAEKARRIVEQPA